MKPTVSKFNSTYIGTSASLSIWSAAMASVPTPEMLSLGILMPCVGEYAYALTHFLQRIDHKCDSCILLHFSMFLRECGTILPLTPFRSALLRSFFTHFQRQLVSVKAQDVANRLLTKFLDSVGLVDPTIEKKKLSIALSLILSQLRHYDNQWRVNEQKIKGTFSILTEMIINHSTMCSTIWRFLIQFSGVAEYMERVLNSLQTHSQGPLKLTPSIARNVDAAMEHMTKVQSLHHDDVHEFLVKLL